MRCSAYWRRSLTTRGRSFGLTSSGTCRFGTETGKRENWAGVDFFVLRITTSGYGGMMLRFYHIGASTGPCLKKCAQRPKCADVNSRRCPAEKSAATRGVKHPSGNFQKCTRSIIVNSADEHELPTAIASAADSQLPSIQRMPGIQHPSFVSFMGVQCLGCTTGAARTPHSVLEFRNPPRTRFGPATTDTRCPPDTVL